MATIYTHAAVGLGLARLYAARPMPWAFWGLAALVPVLPDLDVFFWGTYGGPWGHRGVTHSLLVALLLGTVAGRIVCRRSGSKGWSLIALFCLIAASHGVLDALTKGGADIPFFWPLPGRYGNWGLIHVSDISFQLPDPRHSRALHSELLWVWTPMTVLVGVTMLYRRLWPTTSVGESAVPQ
jgi:inner membrane protein